MIRTFRHKGLKRLYESGDASGVQPKHVEKLRRIILTLDNARQLGDVNLPGFRLHPLKGDRKGEWAVSVDGNWRVTFAFEEDGVFKVNYEDYH